MDSRLTPDTESRIRALCDEIAVAYDVDEDLREELRGHVEDKVLAYLSGEEAVCEADALILAREHFGDRARLKRLLSEVHHVEAGVSLLRRIAAAAIVTLWAQLASRIVEVCLTLVAGIIASRALASSATVNLGNLPRYAMPFLTVALIWLSFAWMKERMQRGRVLWIQRRKGWSLAAAAALTFTAIPLIPLLAVFLPQTPLVIWGGGSPREFWPAQGILVLRMLSNLMIVLLWLWWCNARPRRNSALLWAAASWSLVAWLSTEVSASFHLSRYEPAPEHFSLLARFDPLTWWWGVPSMGEILRGGTAFLLPAATALLGFYACCFVLRAAARHGVCETITSCQRL